MKDNTTLLLNTLAEKLGTTTQYLWNVLLKQAKVELISDIVFNIMFIMFGYISYIIVKRTYKSFEDRECLEILLIVSYVLLAVMNLIFIIQFLVNIDAIINCIFNPEYWALKEVLKAIKSN